MYDKIRNIVINHLNASLELQEALITWYMTHPEEYRRAEQRLGEGDSEQT